MCGIVGGTSNRNILPILVEGLRRLEYRGYDPQEWLIKLMEKFL